MKKSFFFFVLLLLSVNLLAEKLEVTADVNRTNIGINDVLEYTIEISGKNADRIGTPDLPRLEGFKNIGVSKSSSSSFSIINGTVESSVTNKYTYSLLPQKQGMLTIPSITIKYKKQSYKTQAIKIRVVPGSNEPAPSTRSKTRSHSSNSNQKSEQKLSDNLFIETIISDKNPYQNEPVELIYKIYTKYSISSLSFDETPSFTGFWTEEVYSPKNVNFRRETINDDVFNSMILKTYALFPSQTGNIEIEPLKMNVDIRTEPSSFFDFGSTKSYIISSKPLVIKVKELPSNTPKGFNGAVGSFKLKSSISESSLKVGESLTYTLEISGKGNFNNMQIAELPEINHLRFLDPETQTSVQSNKVNGKKIIRYLVIAQEPGEFTIPSITFTYFDPTLKKYRSLKSDQYSLSVQEGDNIYIPGSTSQSEIQIEGSDIAYIIETNELSSFKSWFDSFLYWVLLFTIFLILPVSMLILKRHMQLSTDLDYQRNKRANRVLKKYLKLAAEFHKNSDPAFYSAVQSGLENYLTDKLKIPRGSRKDEIISTAAKLGFTQSLIDKVNVIFNRCNEARFMPGGFSADNINEDFHKLKNLISDLDKFKIKGI